MSTGKRYRSPVLLQEWTDLYHFAEGPVQMECPDCGQKSAPVEDIYTAAVWVDNHTRKCEA